MQVQAVAGGGGEEKGEEEEVVVVEPGRTMVILPALCHPSFGFSC